MSLTGHAIAAQSGKPERLVIFLHGYGSNGADLISLAPYFAQIDPKADFVSPDAPQACPLSPGGYQWFPLPYIDGSTAEEMTREFIKAKAALNAYIDQELSTRGLANDALVLIGFSQGTMMSLETGLRRSTALAGIIGFSGRILLPEALEAEIASRPPVALIHGELDDVVPVNESIDAQKRLSDLGLDVRLHLSPNTPHSIAPDGLDFALKFYQSEVLS